MTLFIREAKAKKPQGKQAEKKFCVGMTKINQAGEEKAAQVHLTPDCESLDVANKSRRT